MKPQYLLAGWIAMALGISAAAYAHPTQQHSLTEAEKSALLARERLSQEVAPIKSRADLERYLHMVPPKSNALYLLSPNARERFIASVTFNAKGLTGFNTTDLQRELSEAQIAKILALFGSESSARIIAAQKRPAQARPRADKGFCFDADPERPQFSPGNCDPGDGIWDEPFHPHPEPKIPIPIPPSPDPVPGSIHPVPLPNGDIYHMECAVTGSTCSPHNNWICKAKC
ncbi:hypothetical protein HF313_17480 [Massilia atriviolacea]|uniref:Uncharacterized protein n=1 Tax=Massilia atriviolacea TaxID=2495579 RepID=A0A430HTM2_9BURK|nr:hypothetical protein [Massilia atriviolacea]RSZ60918.1 hypothetical protein EJB06_01925 [Massilia atriviolacea]